MKQYIKPIAESIEANAQSILAGSIPVGTSGANPTNSLAPKYRRSIYDDDNELDDMNMYIYLNESKALDNMNN